MLRSVVLRGVLVVASTIAPPMVSAAAPNIVTNGGFEDPLMSPHQVNTTPTDPLPGWTVTAGNVNQTQGTHGSATGSNLAYEGSNYLDLVGQFAGNGSIYQLLTTQPGQTYLLTFAYSNGPFSGQAPSASASFSAGDLIGTVFHDTATTSDLNWSLYSGTFVASGQSTTLTFTNLTGGNLEGILLDAISATPVPEPSTWTMMLLGFGAIGVSLRRGRRKSGGRTHPTLVG